MTEYRVDPVDVGLKAVRFFRNDPDMSQEFRIFDAYANSNKRL